MAVTVLERVAKLRESASHCRALMLGAIPFHVAQELESFAAEMDAEAARLEKRIREKRRAARNQPTASDRPAPATPRSLPAKPFGARSR